MRENLTTKGYRGDTQNGRKSGCSNRKRRRNNTDTVDGDADQRDGNLLEVWECRTLEDCKGTVDRLYLLRQGL